MSDGAIERLITARARDLGGKVPGGEVDVIPLPAGVGS